MLILLVIYAKSFNTNQIHLIARINRKQQLKPKTEKEKWPHAPSRPTTGRLASSRPAASRLGLIGRWCIIFENKNIGVIFMQIN